MNFTKNELLFKLNKRKETLSKIIKEKQESLNQYEFTVSGTKKPQKNVIDKLESKKSRLAEYQEHYDMLLSDLNGADNKSEEELGFIWSFFDNFVQSSKSVQKVLEEKKERESETKKTFRGRPKKRP